MLAPWHNSAFAIFTLLSSAAWCKEVAPCNNTSTAHTKQAMQTETFVWAYFACLAICYCWLERPAQCSLLSIYNTLPNECWQRFLLKKELLNLTWRQDMVLVQSQVWLEKGWSIPRHLCSTRESAIQIGLVTYHRVNTCHISSMPQQKFHNFQVFGCQCGWLRNSLSDHKTCSRHCTRRLYPWQPVFAILPCFKCPTLSSYDTCCVNDGCTHAINHYQEQCSWAYRELIC